MTAIERTTSCCFRFPVESPTKDMTHIQVSVGYTKGGTNMLSGDFNAGGIYAYVQPVEIKDGIVSMVLFHGCKHRLESATRLNRKRVEALFEDVVRQFEAQSGIVYDMALKVIAEESGINE